MSQGPRLPLVLGRGVADSLCQAFAPGCHRIETVGSVRRQVAPGDIELLAIPRYERVELEPAAGDQLVMFEARQRVLVNRLHDAITTASEGFSRLIPIVPGASEPEDGGSWPTDERWASKRTKPGAGYFRLWNPRHGIKIDVYMVSPECWGVAKVLRTGPKNFSKAVVTRWASLPGADRVDGNRLTCVGFPPVETPTERSVFEALGAAWIEPESREGGFDVLQEAVWQLEQERQAS